MITTTKKCGRCKATGMTGHVVMGGVCFKCNGRGWVYTDKFTEAYGEKPGRFFGVTGRVYYNEGNPNNGVYKSIVAEADLPKMGITAEYLLATRVCSSGTSSAVEIAEEQAEKFFRRYGAKQVRVAGETSKADCRTAA